jgi:hypothetical protein
MYVFGNTRIVIIEQKDGYTYGVVYVGYEIYEQLNCIAGGLK